MKLFFWLIELAIVVAINTAIIAGFVYVLSLLFGFAFTWKIAIGVDVSLILIKLAVGKKE